MTGPPDFPTRRLPVLLLLVAANLSAMAGDWPAWRSDATRVAASRKRFHAAGRMFLQTGNELHVISNDEGLTWDTDHVVVLRNDGAGYDLGYPRSMQLDDGTILTVYYFTDDEQVTHVACTRWRVSDRP